MSACWQLPKRRAYPRSIRMIIRNQAVDWWWFSHSEIRDEKVALVAAYLPHGTYEYSYIMRASVPGEYNVIPATAYEMYFPEVLGRSDGGRFVVEGE